MTPDTLAAVAADPAEPRDPFADRVSDLLIALEGSALSRVVLRPLADMRVIGSDAIVFATVFVDVGAGPAPYCLAEIACAIDCLLLDPPVADPAPLIARLTLARDQAIAAAQRLTDSLDA